MHRTFHTAPLILIFAASFAVAQGPVRHAVVAGSFYPGTRDSLLEAVAACSQNSKRLPPLHGMPVGIIAPHAGYAFSGPVAATAFRAIEQGLYKTVVILGPSHFIPFNGIAIWPTGAWETPLGLVAIDEPRAKTIMQRCAFVHDSAALFGHEHSLEVQLPFIQRTMPRCKIIPLEFGTVTGEQFAQLADVLTELVEDAPGEILIIASSDLSHYHTDSQARHIDNTTLGDIVAGNLEQLVADLNSSAAEMCGFAPVITMMLVADRLGAQPTLLAYATTANATGDTSRVVGYSAVAFANNSQPTILTAADRSALLTIARHAIEAAANKQQPPDIPRDSPDLNMRSGLFVTLKKHGELRGCIGSIRPFEPLWKAASDMGNDAACHDPRFTPITPEELKDISIEISVLSPLQRITPNDSIIIGIHGLYLVKGSSSGVLLPQVAQDNYWMRDEFLRQICIKAGLPEDAYKDPDARLYRFSAEVFP